MLIKKDVICMENTIHYSVAVLNICEAGVADVGGIVWTVLTYKL